MSNPNGNPGYRSRDGRGRIPQYGAVSDFSRQTGLSRVVIIAGLHTGKFYVGADGLIYPRPSDGGGAP